MNRMNTIVELMYFMWKRKLWWLIPMIVALVIVATLMVFAKGSAVAPFIYTLF